MLSNKTLHNKLNVQWLIAVVILLVSVTNIFAQDTIEKKDPVISLNYFSINSDSFFVQVGAKYKENKAFTPIENHKLKLYINETDAANFLGEATTNFAGEAKIFISKKFRETIDTLSSFDLIAEAEGDSKYEDASGSVTVENVSVEFEINEVDSTKTLHAFVYKQGLKGKTPLPDIELNFYASRTFGLLPLSGDNLTTDESGIAEMEYTGNLPGDSLGTLIVGVKLSDADTYGNLIMLKKTYWGKKVFINHAEAKRAALWASRTNVPIWLLILSNGIIIGVWGTIVFLVFQIFKIRKLGKS